MSYPGQYHALVAVDCIIFGFDGINMKLLLVRRAMKPEANKWSLMGGFLEPHETLDQAAERILRQLTGLHEVYLQQFHTFSEPDRDPEERTVSVAYFALIDIHKYQTQLSNDYRAEWFPMAMRPRLIFDHDQMVAAAQRQLRYRAALHPILFELLPERFTIPQLQSLYEGVYETQFDKRNFTRKLMSTGLFIKMAGKDKSTSRKGAFYYKLDRRKYKLKQQSFLNFVPKAEKFL